MVFGIFLGLSACVLWGLTYLLPLLLPDYPTTLISTARAIVMGLCALAGLWMQRNYLKKVSFKDWRFALILTLVGNLLQPWCLFSAVQYAGVPLAATFFGLIPVLVAVIANERDRRKGKPFLPLQKLYAPIVLLFGGLMLSNWEGLAESLASGRQSAEFFIGIVFALASTAMWTWYPIKNSDWLLEHPKVSPVFFASMQCSLLLPFGLIVYAALCILTPEIHSVFGPKPIDFIGWSLFAGVFCSFLAAALWNAMSQRVPAAVAGPMLVFETVFSVFWGCVYERTLPSLSLFCGLVMLVAGVVYALNLFNKMNSQNAKPREAAPSAP